MRVLIALIALALASTYAAEPVELCWSSNQFGGYLVCGPKDNPHPATAEEIKRDQEYYAWKQQNYELFSQNVAARLEETLVGLDPIVANRIRSAWASVQNKSKEKVEVFLEVQKGSK